MPEYLAPGVYVEETSFRPKTIEGVSTSTAGFVGPARFGPIQGEPELLTSFADFERYFGGLEPLAFTGQSEPQPNFLAHAVRAFFEEGGRRCYAARIYEGTGGRAQSDPDSLVGAIRLTARFPGAAGNMRIAFIPRLSPNLLRENPTRPAGQRKEVRRIKEHDVVLVTTLDSTPTVAYFHAVRVGDDVVLQDDQGQDFDLQQGVAIGDDNRTVQLLSVDVAVSRPVNRPLRPEEQYEPPEVFDGFSLDPRQQRSLSQYFTENPSSRRLALTVPFAIAYDETLPGSATGIDFAEAIFGAEPNPNSPSEFRLSNGSDGAAPQADTYLGQTGDTSGGNGLKSGLRALEALEDISIVAAPGYSYGYTTDPARQSTARTIQQHLISHAEDMKYRIAVLDSPDNAVVSEVREFRGQIDSKHAALYYPWIRIVDPLSGRETHIPPSGNVAGIYARNDIEFGVQKAPANEIVRLAVGFEVMISKAQQDVLNPEGINCFRFFEGRGYRLWGARTATSDGEWKYVNLRRYFAYLERSIDKGTQIYVFESNGERLWANVRATVESFLLNEWKSARLMGLTPEEAYFVRCDRSTMTQNDIDNGRLICLIGVAPLRPAEFVIFRIGQKLIETPA